MALLATLTLEIYLFIMNTGNLDTKDNTDFTKKIS